eukprot:7695630-Alexandrium_andersonii.AAC.1
MPKSFASTSSAPSESLAIALGCQPSLLVALRGAKALAASLSWAAESNGNSGTGPPLSQSGGGPG